MAKATAKAYASPGCVLVAFDWIDGPEHPDFLGFAIQRTPGFGAGGAPSFLFNKLDFAPPTKDAVPKTSDKAPFQKFNWWDGGINPKDRGKTFEYAVFPVLGSGPDDLRLQRDSAAEIKVVIPNLIEGRIATYFNRAVVSAQSFLKIKDKPLDQRMTWLANGLQDAIPKVLGDSDAFDCAIYHFSDKLWILPAFEKFTGRGSISYFVKGKDTKSAAAIAALKKTNDNLSSHKRDKIAKLMHDKFIVSYDQAGKEVAVLMGSTNFTPEAQTIQANLLHIVHSPKLADLYAQRAHRLAANPTTGAIAKGADWQEIDDIPGSTIRVMFLPEPKGKRSFLDTVTEAVQNAKSSVIFCMYTASDTALMDAIFAQGDSKDHLIYGLLNSVDDPDKPTKKGEKRKLPAIAATIFHRTREKADTLPYAAFGANAPRGWLPELRAIDTSAYDASAKKSGKKGGPPPIHVHHKFIVIDGDTDHPTIYSGSPNFSKSSEEGNDENVLEIKDNVALAHVYVAEFLRLYNHYRARAIWAREHESHGDGENEGDVLVLKTTRDAWVKQAYREGSKDFLARTRGL